MVSTQSPEIEARSDCESHSDARPLSLLRAAAVLSLLCAETFHGCQERFAAHDRERYPAMLE